MQQLSLAWQAEFQRYAKKTRREQFLEEMDVVMPWSELLALVAPYYSTGETGRKPVGLEIMLRVYFLQQWFLRTSIWAGLLRHMRRRFSTSVTCSKNTILAARCWMRSTFI